MAETSPSRSSSDESREVSIHDVMETEESPKDKVAKRQYAPLYDDCSTREIEIDPKKEEFQEFLNCKKTIHAKVLSVGSIKFDIELERVKVKKDTHKDFLAHVYCHRDGLDPHWRCSFEVEVFVKIEGDPPYAGQAEARKSDARLNDNCLTIPVMRIQEGHIEECNLEVTVKLTKWEGFHPQLLHCFEIPTEYTNATLLVEAHTFYVTREILAIHSEFFNNLFFNDNFADAAKEEYFLPDVEYEEMKLFLKLCYPEAMVGQREIHVRTFEDLERMLLLSEKFSAPAFKNLAERMLRSALTNFPKASPTQLLHIADRFRLSSACSRQLRTLQSERDFLRLRQSDEYEKLSVRIRSHLLTTALEKLPKSTKIVKEKRPSRSGRPGEYSEEEVDGDEDDITVVAAVRAPNPPRRCPEPTPAEPPASTPAEPPASTPANQQSVIKRKIKQEAPDAEDDAPLPIAVQKRPKVDVKEELESDGDQPGPSNPPPKRIVHSTADQTTRTLRPRRK